MDCKLTLEIAGIPLVVCAAQRRWLEPIGERFGAFVTWGGSEQDNAISVFLTYTPNIERAVSWNFQYESSPAAAFGISTDTTPNKAVVERTEDGSVRAYAGTYDGTWDGSLRADVSIFVEPVAFPFEGFLLGVLPDILLSREACFLHASGLVSGSHAYLFTGPSGSGKTTVVENSPEHTVLSDELVVVRRHDDGCIWAWGTPFFGSWGKPGTPVAAPVAWIHFLSKAQENRLEPLSARESFRRLCGVICYKKSNTAVTERLLALADQMVPLCRLLHSYPGPAIWPLVEGHREEEHGNNVEAECHHQSTQF